MRFVEKVMKLFGSKRYDGMTLSRLVTLLADQPRGEIRDAFYRRLLKAKVGARLPKSAAPHRTGTFVSTKEDDLRIPDVHLPDGSVCLAVHCDIPAMVAAFPDDRFFELDARVVLQIAKDNGCGLVVQNGLDGRDSWACVPRQHIEALLEEKG